ncbi:hypothetical protein, partial [Bradyrhizobium sp.]|uniref:hypothetical protein n=1 Tax=Bradyrhizobium sp. TaxID=376 RepID=UPI002CF753A5
KRTFDVLPKPANLISYRHFLIEGSGPQSWTVSGYTSVPPLGRLMPLINISPERASANRAASHQETHDVDTAQTTHTGVITRQHTTRLNRELAVALER